MGRFDLGEGMHKLKDAMTLNEEIIQLRQQVKVKKKEIRLLKKRMIFWREPVFFRSESSEVNKNERMN